MNKQELSKNNRALLCAHSKGYKVNKEGEVISPSGKKLKLRKKEGKPGIYYLAFSVYFEGQNHPVKIHRLAAYQKFGDKMFEEGIEVRHLDDDQNNNFSKNLLLGTHKRNMFDKKERYKKDNGETSLPPELKENGLIDNSPVGSKISDYLGSN